jgi:predicted dehydrogenase
MLKIGLLGSDSSHAERFSELLNRPDHPNYIANADAKIVAIWGEDAARTRQAATLGQIATIVDAPGDLMGQVDAVFCITRHGGKHLNLVRPYLEAGVPVFVDKPLATEPTDARAIVELAQQRGTPFTSFSTVRFSADTQDFLAKSQTLGGVRAGVYTGPASRRNPYGGVIFYAIHSIELMLMVQGTGVAWVQALEAPAVDAEDNGNMTAVCAWPDGATATLELTVDAHYGFRALAVGKDGFHCADIDISDCYREGMQRILPCLRGERDGGVPVAQMIEAVQVGKAIDRSLDENRRVYLNEL